MSSHHPAIRVRNLGKKYTLGGSQKQYLTLRDIIVNSVEAPFKRFQFSPSDEGFWALKDVSFDVEPGEVVGMIDRCILLSVSPYWIWKRPGIIAPILKWERFTESELVKNTPISSGKVNENPAQSSNLFNSSGVL